MIADTTFRLATAQDAQTMALLSRDLIEMHLGWWWTRRRILASMRRADTNAVVAVRGQHIVGFALMKYKEEEAYLHLFAVHPSAQRLGIGTALITWLEKTVRTAGIGLIYLEARQANTAARAFYKQLGYQEIKTVPHMYRGIEDGVRIAKDLWAAEAPLL
jgi:[ribosomal protein S18]-alanine N-acetyltransferase